MKYIKIFCIGTIFSFVIGLLLFLMLISLDLSDKLSQQQVDIIGNITTIISVLLGFLLGYAFYESNKEIL